MYPSSKPLYLLSPRGGYSSCTEVTLSGEKSQKYKASNFPKCLTFAVRIANSFMLSLSETAVETTHRIELTLLGDSSVSHFMHNSSSNQQQTSEKGMTDPVVLHVYSSVPASFHTVWPVLTITTT